MLFISGKKIQSRRISHHRYFERQRRLMLMDAPQTFNETFHRQQNKMKHNKV
jgi:hypothetical protein